MSKDLSEYRSRGFDREAQARYISLLLRKLAEAEAKTDPANGNASAEGKDHEAFSALLRAGELVDAVAGWAIDHVCGLSLHEQSLLPRQPSRSKEHHEYCAYREFVDQHGHEKTGGGQRQASLTSIQKRVLLRNLLFGGSMAGPNWLREEAFQAFDALAFGEVVPLLTPDPQAGSKVRYQELRAQLSLIAIARFRGAAYGGILDEFKFVAEKTGVSFETLRTWEKRLREELGRLEVDRTIEFATNAASHVKHLNDRRDKGFALSENELASRQNHEGRYGNEALEAAVADYHRIRAQA